MVSVLSVGVCVYHNVRHMQKICAIAHRGFTGQSPEFKCFPALTSDFVASFSISQPLSK